MFIASRAKRHCTPKECDVERTEGYKHFAPSEQRNGFTETSMLMAPQGPSWFPAENGDATVVADDLDAGSASEMFNVLNRNQHHQSPT